MTKRAKWAKGVVGPFPPGLILPGQSPINIQKRIKRKKKKKKKKESNGSKSMAKGLLCAKMSVRSGLRCSCHYVYAEKCPARTDRDRDTRTSTIPVQKALERCKVPDWGEELRRRRAAQELARKSPEYTGHHCPARNISKMLSWTLRNGKWLGGPAPEILSWSENSFNSRGMNCAKNGASSLSARLGAQRHQRRRFCSKRGAFHRHN